MGRCILRLTLVPLFIMSLSQVIHACMERAVKQESGKIVCEDCKLCPAGYEVHPPCGTGHVYDKGKFFETCAPCSDGQYKQTVNGQKNFLNCSSCDKTGCGNHVILSPCTKTSPFKCSHKCQEGHFKKYARCVASTMLSTMARASSAEPTHSTRSIAADPTTPSPPNLNCIIKSTHKDDTAWRTVAIVAIVASVLLVVLIVGILFYFRQRIPTFCRCNNGDRLEEANANGSAAVDLELGSIVNGGRPIDTYLPVQVTSVDQYPNQNPNLLRRAASWGPDIYQQNPMDDEQAHMLMGREDDERQSLAVPSAEDTPAR